MKARDIIPGWPRGRSTTTSNSNSRWTLTEEGADFLVTFYHSTLRGVTDLMEDREYHRGQSTMLDRHRSEYRRPTAAWLARKIMQHGGGLVIATCNENPALINLGEEPGRPWSFDPTGKGIETATTRVEDTEEAALQRFLYANFTVDHRE